MTTTRHFHLCAERSILFFFKEVQGKGRRFFYVPQDPISMVATVLHEIATCAKTYHPCIIHPSLAVRIQMAPHIDMPEAIESSPPNEDAE